MTHRACGPRDPSTRLRVAFAKAMARLRRSLKSVGERRALMNVLDVRPEDLRAATAALQRLGLALF